MSSTPQSAAAILGSGAYRRFQVAAWVTGTVLAFMTVVGLPWKYLLGHGETTWYAVGWQLHGFLFMVYVVTVLDLAIRARWRPGRTVMVALAGTIPFLSFVFERRITHELRRGAAASTRRRATGRAAAPAEGGTAAAGPRPGGSGATPSGATPSGATTTEVTSTGPTSSDPVARTVADQQDTPR